MESEVPHEIHVTVSSENDIAQFKVDCQSIGVKPILLVLHTATSRAKDMMTSQTITCTTEDAFRAMDTTVKGLEALGYKVLRSKIEAAPWHPLVPTADNGLMHAEGNYFEAHIQVIVHNVKGSPQNIVNLKTLLSRASLGLHVSANYFKALDEHSTVMVTARGTEPTLEDFKYRVDRARNYIVEVGYAVEHRSVIEYAIYDSNQGHDKEWMRGKR